MNQKSFGKRARIMRIGPDNTVINKGRFTIARNSLFFSRFLYVRIITGCKKQGGKNAGESSTHTLVDSKAKIRLGSVNRGLYLDKYYAKNFELPIKSPYFRALIVWILPIISSF
jgi:hypothetical protein